MRERALELGPGGALVGVLCEPAGARSPVAVCFLNAGVVHRPGPNRIHVKLARDLAAAGVASLRFDFSGVGDSAPRRDGTRFEASAVAETRSAMDELARAAGAERFVLAGLCSGAEIAFKTAVADERVAGAILMNAPRFLEEPSAELVAHLEGRQESAYLWRVALFDPRSWGRALRGRADFRALFRALRDRVRESPASGDFGADADREAFRALAGRGARLLGVFSEGDWGWDYLRAILGDELAELERSELFDIAIVERADHMLTPLAAQERLRALVVDWTRRLAAAAVA